MEYWMNDSHVNTTMSSNMIWTKINKPSHPAVIELVERHSHAIFQWKMEEFNIEYSKLEQHLLKTIVLPDDVPTIEDLRMCGGILHYQSYKLRASPTNRGRSLQDFIIISRCYFDSVWEHFTRLSKRLSLLSDAMWNMDQHIKKMRQDRELARTEAEKVKLKAIEERKARQLAEEEQEARRRLAAIEWEAGRAAREEAKRLEEEAREARIIAKMEELRTKKKDTIEIVE